MQEPKFNKVNLFITCLIDNFFPEVGESVVNVLSKLGIEVDFIESQTCCGQPAYNSGYQEDAREVAIKFIETYKDVNTPIVCPSGSCTSMITVFYDELLKHNINYKNAINNIKQRTFEFTDFLVNHLNTVNIGSKYEGTVTYHDSCHSLRELGLKNESRQLLNAINGLKLIEMDMCDACCGFGGTFSVKNPEVSISMVEEKVNSALQTDAEAIVSSDMGCLMNINGYISRKKLPIKTMHIAQVLDF